MTERKGLKLLEAPLVPNRMCVIAWFILGTLGYVKEQNPAA